MYVLLSVIMAIIPALFLVWYYYKQDREKPEPKGLIIKTFLLGIVIIIPVVIMEIIIAKSFSGLLFLFPLGFYFVKAFIVAAFSEEILKLWVVRKYIYTSGYFDEVMDGIVYMVVASLGFACFENILYVMEHGLGVAVVRAFTAVPLHAFASGLMGFYLGKAKFASSKKEETALIYRGLLIAILVHGFYDFVLFAVPVFGIIPALSIFPLLVWGFLHLKKNIATALSEDIHAG